MARVPAGFVNSTLWPEFRELDRTLAAYLNEITERVISESIHADNSEVEVRGGAELPETASLSD